MPVRQGMPVYTRHTLCLRHWREVHLQMYIGIGFLLFPPLCLTWWWCMNTSIHHKEKRRFLSHLSVLLFFLTNYVQCCLADWVGLDP